MNGNGHGFSRRPRVTLLVLLIVFAAPFAGSWFLFNFTHLGRGDGSGAHGNLVVPPRLLPAVELRDIAGVQADTLLRGKWTLLYLLPGPCEESCLAAMYQMRQLRLALGRHTHRMQRALVVYGDFPLRFPEPVAKEYAGQTIIAGSALDGDEPGRNFRMHAGDDPLAAGRLYVVDPMGNLMMAYPAGADPGGIIDDLERLLKYSGAG